jgi:hypothetical protein
MESSCNRKECIYKAVEEVIKKMKEEVAIQSSLNPEDIVVAEIYYIVSSTLADACRKNSDIKFENCIEFEKHKKPDISMDTFILLNSLSEDGFISKEYRDDLYNVLIKLKPEMKKLIED